MGGTRLPLSPHPTPCSALAGSSARFRSRQHKPRPQLEKKPELRVQGAESSQDSWHRRPDPRGIRP